jgi:hypothetical protein
MVRRVAAVTLALLVAGVLYVGDVKEVSGTVKSVIGGIFVVTDSAAKDWTFTVDSKEMLVVAKGGRYKMDQLKVDGKLATIGEFLAEKQLVLVKYGEEGRHLIARKCTSRSRRSPRSLRAAADSRARPPASRGRSAQAAAGAGSGARPRFSSKCHFQIS